MLKTNYNVYSDELYHHGIQGQKWGQRNGPPYPLSQGMRTAAERKENKKSSYTHPEVEAKKVKKAKRGSYGGGADVAKQHAELAKRAEERSKNDKKAYSDYVNRLDTLDTQYSDYKMAKRAKLYSKDELKEMKKDYKQSKKDFNEAYKADKKAIKRGYIENEAKKEQARQDAYDKFKTLTELLGTKIDEKWSVDKYNDNVDKNMKKAGVIDSNHSGVGRVW